MRNTQLLGNLGFSDNKLNVKDTTQCVSKTNGFKTYRCIRTTETHNYLKLSQLCTNVIFTCTLCVLLGITILNRERAFPVCYKSRHGRYVLYIVHFN